MKMPFAILLLTSLIGIAVSASAADSGSPALTRYRRVIVTAKETP